VALGEGRAAGYIPRPALPWGEGILRRGGAKKARARHPESEVVPLKKTRGKTACPLRDELGLKGGAEENFSGGEGGEVSEGRGVQSLWVVSWKGREAGLE